ncbi:hypothetical protein [Streptomyces sp. NBC_00005]
MPHDLLAVGHPHAVPGTRARGTVPAADLAPDGTWTRSVGFLSTLDRAKA